MDRPSNPTALRSFVGAVNFYRDMWPSRVHILKPLTDKAGLKKRDKLVWTDKIQIAFVKMKKLMVVGTLSRHSFSQVVYNPFLSVYTYQKLLN